MSLAFQIPRYCLLWLLIAQALVVAPHFGRIPTWLIVAWVVCVGWRILVYQGRWTYPGGFVKLLLVLSSGVGVIMTYGSFFGLEPTVALLITAYIFKLLEMRSRRDIIVVIYLSYFVIVTQLLFTQSLPHVFYLMGSAILVTTSLIVLHQSADRVKFWAPLILSTKMIFQALPLMVIMFLVFPRLEPFWAVPLPQHQNQTGMGDRMSPGDISKLAKSDELAFRADFEGFRPKQGDLYWRGLVLSDFNGRSWTPLSEVKTETLPEDYLVNSDSKMYQYTVLIEPTNQQWLFAMPVAVSSDRDVRYDQDFIISSNTQVKKRRKYEVVSYTNVIREPEMSELRRNRFTKLPDNYNPRTIEMARQWMRESKDPQAYVARVLRYFSQMPFEYSLQPPRLGKHSVDEFLFRTRKGFCEHYASTFTFLMRAGGIPARVVMGYQGGTRSPYDNYIIVRQLDAHAWSEVWFPEAGWIRVDPTSQVSPDRIEATSEEVLSQQEAFLSNSPLSLTHLNRIAWVREVQLRYDQINHRWHSWVLGYDANLQFATLKRLLGEVTPQRLVVFILLSGGAVVLAIALALLLRRAGPKRSPAVKAYLSFCNRISRIGVVREPAEGAYDYAQRVIEKRPDLNEEVSTITDLFVSIEYGAQQKDPESIKQLKSLVREIRLNPKLYQRRQEEQLQAG